jgi:hypothetical protein
VVRKNEGVTAGEFEDPRAGLLPAMMNLLRNGFIAAFAHALQGTIDLDDVAGDPACFGHEIKRDTAEPRVERAQPRQDQPERRRDRDDREREGVNAKGSTRSGLRVTRSPVCADT